jgi:hypothetical protein
MRRTPYAALSRLGSASWARARSEQFRLVVPADEDLPPVVDLASLCHRPFVASPSHLT